MLVPKTQIRCHVAIENSFETFHEVSQDMEGVALFASFNSNMKNLVPTSKDQDAEQEEEAVEWNIGQTLVDHVYDKAECFVEPQEKDHFVERPAHHHKS